jgi:hypothetical protein
MTGPREPGPEAADNFNLDLAEALAASAAPDDEDETIFRLRDELVQRALAQALAARRAIDTRPIIQTPAQVIALFDRRLLQPWPRAVA